MNRYYDECLKEIQKALNSGQVEKARTLLKEELSMPFIPEPYNTQFETLYAELPKVSTSSSFYTDIDDVVEGLLSKDERQVKALFSMQRMNLRMHLSELKGLLVSSEIEDEMKNFILITMLEQNISGIWQVSLKNRLHELDLKNLKLPYETEAYRNTYQKLRDRYESFDPSFLQLCVMELNALSHKRFPFSHEEIDEKEVIQRVKRAFSYSIDD